MLAASTLNDEASALVYVILERYLGPSRLSDELAAGKLIVEMFDLFQEGKEDAISLEPRLWSLSCDLGHPSWLIMLCRNCEYATDVPAFERPFLDEFQYISGLWKISNIEAEFKARYQHNISQSHDIQ